MKITIARHNKDRYIIIETEGKTVTFKAKMLMKTSETSYSDTEDFIYESEVFEATFLREENDKNKSKDKENK